MSVNINPPKIDLKSLKLSKVNAEWYENSNSDPIFMISPFHELIHELMRKDLEGYYRLYRAYPDVYKNLWGNHAFVFEGRKQYKTWVFELNSDEHLVLLCAPGKGSSFEYSGLREPSEIAAQKAISILMTLKDELLKYEPSELEPGM